MAKYPTTMAAEDLMGLSDYAREVPHVVEKALSLQADRAIYESVRARLIENGELDYVDVEKSEHEFLQYALLCAVTREQLSPSPLADEFWHEFLMDTRAYSGWCSRHFGHFLHHQPESIGSLEERGIVQRSRSLYGEYFVASGQGIMDTCFGTNCGNSNG